MKPWKPAVPQDGRDGNRREDGRHFIPSGLVFRDETGAEVKLGSLLGKPAILTLVYYTCDHICPLMLSGLAQALPRLSLTPGKDYRLLTVSFDETDTPALRRESQERLPHRLGIRSWRKRMEVPVGDRESIDRLMAALGLRYRRDIHGFIHPVVLILTSPGGRSPGICT